MVQADFMVAFVAGLLPAGPLPTYVLSFISVDK
jgi:hypothetical protein